VSVPVQSAASSNELDGRHLPPLPATVGTPQPRVSLNSLLRGMPMSFV
jgi:hypothetical protein